MSQTSKVVSSLIVILASAIFIYSYRDKLPATIKDISLSLGISRPCTDAITYSLVSFDTRFGMTKEQYEEDISEAASIWENALDRKLFSFQDSGGELDMNLIYDYRQQATDNINQVDLTINSDKGSYNFLKAKYDSLQIEYSQKRSATQRDLDAYQTKKASYDQEIAGWNQKGGAPSAIYKQLEQERISLNSEAASLNQRQNDLNIMVDEINSSASILNKLAHDLNLNVKTHNDIGKSTGEEFNEGEYIEDSSGKSVNIYQFKDNNQLIRVLEHELGHALGLDHVADPKAIMYRLNEGTNQTLTDDDIKELDRVCKIPASR